MVGHSKIPVIEPAQPLIVFASGDRAIVVREEVVHKRGVDYSRLYMNLPTVVRARYNISSKALNFDIHPDGIFTREYPKSKIVKLSDNPEDPLWFCFSNFDGTSVNIKTFKPISEVISENEFLKMKLKSNKAQIESLRMMLTELSDSVIKFRNKFKQLYKSDDKADELLRLLLMPGRMK